jgi:hypothetical protein
MMASKTKEVEIYFQILKKSFQRIKEFITLHPLEDSHEMDKRGKKKKDKTRS